MGLRISMGLLGVVRIGLGLSGFRSGSKNRYGSYWVRSWSKNRYGST